MDSVNGSLQRLLDTVIQTAHNTGRWYAQTIPFPGIGEDVDVVIKDDSGHLIVSLEVNKTCQTSSTVLFNGRETTPQEYLQQRGKIS